MNKKGVTRKVLTGMLFLIAGFMLLLTIYLQFGELLQSISEVETCHGSVLIRGAAVEKFTSVTKPVLPGLKCKTNYWCFEKGEKCGPGYEPVPASYEEDIEKKIAEEMKDCWYKLGRGQIDFVGRHLFKENVCVICSRMTFDKAVQEDIGTITDFDKYLNSTRTSTGQLYSVYLSNNKSSKVIGTDLPIDLSKEHAVVYSMYTKEYFLNLIAGAAPGAFVGGTIGFFVAGPIGAIVLGSSGALVGTAEVESIKQKTPKNQLIHSLHLVEFDAGKIAQTCPNIESIPNI